MDTTAASDLAHAVASDGFVPHQGALALLLAEAGQRGVSPVLLGVAGDPDEPVVARQRALGGVLAAMASAPDTGAELFVVASTSPTDPYVRPGWAA